MGVSVWDSFPFDVASANMMMNEASPVVQRMIFGVPVSGQYAHDHGNVNALHSVHTVSQSELCVCFPGL